MIPACNYNEIRKELQCRHDFGESCIVGIMFARYEIKLAQEIINECYQFWDSWSGKTFDMFWVGYGGYCPVDPSETHKILMSFPGNHTNNFFDLREFNDTVRFFSRQTDQKWMYSDKLQLMLINYSHSKLRFNEYITVDLEENLDMYHSNIRQLVTDIINKTESMTDVKQIAKSMRTDRFWQAIKGVSVSDIISIATSL